MLLSLDGCRVHIAHNAGGALVVADAEELDLVLLDMQLPDMHGCDLALELRAKARTRNVPLVAVSASDSWADMDRARDAGIAVFMAKPVDGTALRATVAMLLEGNPV